MDVLDGENGTSARVREQMLNNKDFKWTDEYLERDESMQKLYNADGQEISGIALNNYFDKTATIQEVFTRPHRREYQMRYSAVRLLLFIKMH